MTTFAIIKTIQRIGFAETSCIVGYTDTYSEADFAIERLAIQAQYGEITACFSACFSICKI